MSQTNGQPKPTWGEWVEQTRAAFHDKKDTIFANAADGVDPDTYIEAMMLAIGANKKLAECTLSSLAKALTDSATLGLIIGSVLGFGYVVPRNRRINRGGDNWDTIVEAQFQAGYQGKQKLAYESPLVAAVTMEAVHERDTIEVVNGTEPRITHTINPLSRGREIGFYAVIALTSGFPLICYRTREQIDEHMGKYAQGTDKKDSAWKTAYATMAKKTCLTIALKNAPLHTTAREILQREEVPAEPAESFPSGTEAPANDLDAALEAVNQSGDPGELFPEMHGSELPF